MQPSAPPAPLPFVSVIIPCRNEAGYIRACLDTVLGGDFPADRLEVLVVDGMSDDGTRPLLAEASARDPRVRVLDNPRRITPAALNIGVRAARGDVIVRVDAHSEYPGDYVRALVGWLQSSGADNVGGVWLTLPADRSAAARAIAAAMSHPFGVGNSHHKVGVREPQWVDTVPFGCYRRQVFERIGFFDEELVRNQDDEFNHRLLQRGGRILLVPDVVTRYFARGSLAKLARMCWQYGYFKPLAARKLGRIPTLRQLVPPAFVAALAAGAVLAPWAALPLALVAGAYGVTALGFAARELPRLGAAALLLPAAFATAHVSYGAGYLRGVVDFILRGRRGVPDASAVAVTR